MLKIFWFRKDLRIEDNKGLKYFIKSLKADDKFAFIFIKNPNIDQFYSHKRIEFLYESLIELKNDLAEFGLLLQVFKGKSTEIISFINSDHKPLDVYANGQVEPYSIKRDLDVQNILKSDKGTLNLFPDLTIFDFKYIIKENGDPYTVFTPFKNRFLKNLTADKYEKHSYDLNKLEINNQIIINLNSAYNLKSNITARNSNISFRGGRKEGKNHLINFCKLKISDYKVHRDYPSLNSTSLISPHIHFGTIGIRECFREAFNKNNDGVNSWINELIWREFYYNITYHFPEIINNSFKKKFDQLKWNCDTELLSKWKDGLTGFPIVDAGMRQLKAEGWMHNRVRMIAAMFLTKDLFINWREGEKYFSEYLIDFDFSSNNGGWQWSASTGCDAQPYFRIFNPELQSKKFDANGVYIKRYLPELKLLPPALIHSPSMMNHSDEVNFKVRIGIDYPEPIVNHLKAKEYVISKFTQLK